MQSGKKVKVTQVQQESDNQKQLSRNKEKDNEADGTEQELHRKKHKEKEVVSDEDEKTLDDAGIDDGDDDNEDSEVGMGPQLRYATHDHNGEEWEHVEGSFSLLLCANLPAISTDSYLAPYAHLSDGCM